MNMNEKVQNLKGKRGFSQSITETTSLWIGGSMDEWKENVHFRVLSRLCCEWLVCRSGAKGLLEVARQARNDQSFGSEQKV